MSKPDLVIDYFLIVPTTVLGYGDQVTTAFRVQNDGNADAGPSTVRFYYGDRTDRAELIPLSSVDVTGLAAGVTSGDSTVDLILPDNVLYGSRYIHCFIDADGSFTYTPDEEFIGTDSFIYNANDTCSGSKNTEVTLRVRKALSPGMLLLLLDDE